MLQTEPQIMSREDGEVAQEVLALLEDEGIEILPNAQLVGVQGVSGDVVTLSLNTTTGERKVEGSDPLVAVGRIPNTSDIGLDKTGVELDPRGFIRVNERLQTSASGLWAIGECAGSPQFTHVSVDDFRIVRDNMAGGTRRTDDRLIPYVMFTDPPLARVGLSETEAQRKGIAVRVVKLPMNNVLRTQATGETFGFMKAVVGANDDQILGFTMIGSEAGEVMAAVQTASSRSSPTPDCGTPSSRTSRWQRVSVRFSIASRHEARETTT